MSFVLSAFGRMGALQSQGPNLIDLGFPAATAALDDLRAREYARLDETGQVYLDYTGGGQYADLYNTYFRHQSLAYIEEAGKMKE